MPLSGQVCWSGTNGQVRGGGFRTCPGWRTAGSSPIVVLLAAYHLGHSRAISRSLANGPDLLAAMDHRVSPGMTTTPSSSEARGVATRAEGRLSKPGSMIGAFGFHPGVTFRPVFVQAASGDCAVDVLLHPGSGTEAAKAAVPPKKIHAQNGCSDANHESRGGFGGDSRGSTLSGSFQDIRHEAENKG